MTQDLVDQMQAKAAFRDLLEFMTLALRPAHARDSAQFVPYCKIYLDLVLNLGCSPTTIKLAIEYLKSEWTKTGWPTPGELTKILRSIEPVDSARVEKHPDDEAEERPQYSDEHRKRICEGLGRLKTAHNQLFTLVLTAGELSDWCKHAVKPEDLEERLAEKRVAPDHPAPGWARKILETAP